MESSSPSIRLTCVMRSRLVADWTDQRQCGCSCLLPLSCRVRGCGSRETRAQGPLEWGHQEVPVHPHWGPLEAWLRGPVLGLPCLLMKLLLLAPGLTALEGLGGSGGDGSTLPCRCWAGWQGSACMVRPSASGQRAAVDKGPACLCCVSNRWHHVLHACMYMTQLRIPLGWRRKRPLSLVPQAGSVHL